MNVFAERRALSFLPVYSFFVNKRKKKRAGRGGGRGEGEKALSFSRSCGETFETEFRQSYYQPG